MQSIKRYSITINTLTCALADQIMTQSVRFAEQTTALANHVESQSVAFAVVFVCLNRLKRECKNQNETSLPVDHSRLADLLLLADL